MYQVIITVETERQADDVNEALALAEVEQALDFPFNTEIRKVDDFADVKPPAVPTGASPIHDPWGLGKLG